MPYKYVWVSDAAGECATLLFYAMTGLYFRPHAENPYFALQDDEISMAVRLAGPDAFDLPSVSTMRGCCCNVLTVSSKSPLCHTAKYRKCCHFSCCQR